MSRLNRTNLAEAAEEAEVADLANQQTYGLTSPLEYLLTSGGDPRLRIDSVLLLNGYGCQSWPRPAAFTFASSTATSVSERGFAAAAKAQQRLVEATRRATVEETCDREAEWLREQLRTLLRLDGLGTEIIFSPSGTDSQLQALYVAQNLLQGPPVPVIVGSDETGSGTARAMVGPMGARFGQHFGRIRNRIGEVVRIAGRSHATNTASRPSLQRAGVFAGAEAARAHHKNPAANQRDDDRQQSPRENQADLVHEYPLSMV